MKNTLTNALLAVSLSSSMFAGGDTPSSNNNMKDKAIVHRQLTLDLLPRYRLIGHFLLAEQEIEGFKKDVEARNVCLHLEGLKRLQAKIPLIGLKATVAATDGKRVSIEEYSADNCPLSVYQKLSDQDLSYLIEHQDEVKFGIRTVSDSE